ncbi:PadR family transcriptional regulator [Pleionea sp. CnH1-48]|uniref:PadR family transcriptional regulator n=1 Tax=Pleionea sp. CnH1-48 TaxID=2954494 RepID=UPI0020984DE2|nr:PadR family transcriptional regulator [Pleionea sp. CnH1-48]MCO7224276.1 PadR family transcriptional regulator [Pleionea sp. CnH1-48]
MSLKHAILALLTTEDSSGYDLMKRFKERLGYFWNASHQQMYQQLKVMHQDELIEFEVEHQPNKPDRKIYSITPQGQQTLNEWLLSPVKPNKINDALLVKLYAGEFVDTQILIEEMQEHRATHEKMLRTFKELEKEYQALSQNERTKLRLPYLTLRRGILGEEAWLKWADEVDEVLLNLAP